jgi:hypothetical protein
VLVKSKEAVEYCERHNYPYTECPRYIRMNDEGISIEVKRLENG